MFRNPSLREKLVLLKFLFGEVIPKVRSDGFIDYLVKDEMGRGIALEFKPLFEADVELDKSGKPILKRVKQRKLKPENYASQVLKYIRTEFTVDDRRKLELIIGVINKFIFVQTLDDYGVIEFNWIRKRWSYHEQMWQRKGKFMVLKKFLMRA